MPIKFKKKARSHYDVFMRAFPGFFKTVGVLLLAIKSASACRKALHGMGSGACLRALGKLLALNDLWCILVHSDAF